MKKFKILEKEGLKYSKVSGDKNKIHIDELTGYNSIFGEKICHGSFVIIKFFKKINFYKIIKNKNFFTVNIKFLRHVKYSKELFIVKKKYIYEIYQENEKKIIINFSLNDNLEILKLKNSNKSYSISAVNKNNSYLETILSQINFLLNNLSCYVGTIFPGENSLINQININFNKNYDFDSKKIKIISKKLDKRLPIIINQLYFKNYNIQFNSLERPIVKKNLKVRNSILKKKIKNLKANVLIIGGSQGLGYDILQILKDNKKIIKFPTYYKNLLKDQSKDVIPFKFDIYKNIEKIDSLIIKYEPIKIYYFASPKIYFDNKLLPSIKKNYRYVFLEFPLKLLKRYKNRKISFFYPSTTNIIENKKSYYSKVKMEAEIKLGNFCTKNNIPIKIFRFPAINSRQSVSITNPHPKNLFEFLKDNPRIVDKIF